MNTNPPYVLPNTGAVLATTGAAKAVPIHGVHKDADLKSVEGLTSAQCQWAKQNGFKGNAKQVAVLPDTEGTIAAVLAGLGSTDSGEPCGPSDLLAGHLARNLPPATYQLATGWSDPTLAAIAWGLGAYKFNAYKKRPQSGKQDTATDDEVSTACLTLNTEIDHAAVQRTTAAIWLGRDLINTPSNDMGPAELELAARQIAQRHSAICSVIVGDDLLTQNFPLIHAVGRASSRAPRLIDISWGREDAPRVTIVGKGVCFDTGGLDLKPAAAMLLMKKDMGGAAATIALADMVMGAKLDVRLRLLVPAVENSVSANAFRPSDILASRAGMSVEIGNTDAEGRLVLADALTLGDEDAPQLMMTFATLTGAARVALGPDLPPFFADDDSLAAMVINAGNAIGDPVWRMPFWAGYDRMLTSPSADISNTGDSPFAGAITAALFMKRFVKQSQHYAHFDIYGWRPADRALGRKGGEPHAARTMFEVIRQIAEKGSV